MKNTKKKLKGQSKVIKASFQQVDIGQAMAGATLTDDFWAKDILWQLSVFAYNLPANWRVRQKKNKFKRQEHFTLFNLSCRTTFLTGQAFIDWFITVPAKITRSGHQMEIKLYSLSRESGNIIFTKPTGKSLSAGQAGLISSSKRHKKRKEDSMKINPAVHGRGTFY